MSDPVVQTAAEGAPGLSQWQRVTNTFTAPSKTFEDIKRGNKSWWLPLLLFVVVGTAFWRRSLCKWAGTRWWKTTIHLNPKQAERIDTLPPEQRAAQ